MKIAHYFLVSTMALLSAHALSASTCHEDAQGNRICCGKWMRDVYRDGTNVGALLEESHAQLQRAYERAKATDKQLCNYFKGDDCRKTYGAARCSGKPTLAHSAEERIQVLNNARLLVQQWERSIEELIAGLATLSRASKSQGNPGTLLREYGENLADAQSKVKRLKVMLQATQDQVSEELTRTIAQMTRELNTAAQRQTRSYNALPLSTRQDVERAREQVAQEKIHGPSPSAAAKKDSANDIPARTRDDFRHGTSQPSPMPHLDGTTQAKAPKGGTSAEHAGTTNIYTPACENMEHCVTVLDAKWERTDGSYSGIVGKMTVAVRNKCREPIRLGLWVPQEQGYRSTFYRVEAGMAATRTLPGSKNEWALQAAQGAAPDHCLRYP